MRNGKGGESIYGQTFEDEDLKREIDSEGLLCMANKGRKCVGSCCVVVADENGGLGKRLTRPYLLLARADTVSHLAAPTPLSSSSPCGLALT